MRMCAPFKVRCILPAKDSESVQCFELFHNVSRSIRLFSFFSAFMKCSRETLPSAFFSNWLKKLWKRHIFTIRIWYIASLIHYSKNWKPFPIPSNSFYQLKTSALVVVSSSVMGEKWEKSALVTRFTWGGQEEWWGKNIGTLSGLS